MEVRMRKLITFIVVVLFLLIFTGLSFAGGSKEATNGEIGGTITLYTSETLTDVQKIAEKFEQKYPGTKVEIYRSGTVEVTAKLQAEIEANSIKPDVIWFADMAMFQDLGNKGLLLKTDLPEAMNIPKKFVYMGGKAYEARLIYQIVAYNTEKVKKKITGWNDLLDPVFKGKVGSASAFYSGATLTQVATLSKDSKFGWDFYKKLAENDCKIVKGNGAVARNIATGEYYIGITIDFMARALKAKGSPVDYVYQKEGTVYIPTPIGIISKSKNPETAKAFVNFVLSKDGQQVMVDRGYLPLNKNVPLPEGVPSAAKIKILKTDWKYLKENRDMLRKKWGEIMGVM